MAKNIIIPDFEKAPTENVKQNLRNMAEEKGEYEKSKAHHEHLLALNEKRLELMTALSAISDVKNAKVEPTFEFEKDKEWIRLHSEFLKLESAAKRKEVADEVENIKKRMKLINDELARFDEAIPKLEAELAKRGE